MDGDSLLNIGLPSESTSKQGWSASGILTTGNSVKKVQMQADFPEADSYVVEFSIDIPTTGPNCPVTAEALITWSVEGNFVTRRVSVGNGITVQGVGQAVRVVIQDTSAFNADTVGPPAVTPVDYRVSMQVTRGSRGSNSLPPILIQRAGRYRQLTSGVVSTLSVDVPADAGVTSVKCVAYGTGAGITDQGLPPATFMVEHRMSTEVVMKYYLADQQEEFVPLAPGANRVVITLAVPDPGITSYRVGVIFGIDG